MKKKAFKTDIIIIVVLILAAVGIILALTLPDNTEENTGDAPAAVNSRTIADYADKNIGVITGTLFEGFVMEHYPKADISYFNSLPDLTMALNSGKVDAFLLGKASTDALMDENPGITYLDEEAGTFDVGMVFPKSAEGDRIRAQMDEFLTKLKADGTLDGIIAYWNTKEARDTPADMSGLTGENGTLRFATSGDEMPCSYLVSGKPAGIDPDLAIRFCREYGYNIEITITDFSGVIPGLVSGIYDFAGNEIVITDERKESVNFSVPYLSGAVVMMVQKAADTGIPDLSSYNGKRLGIVTGSSFEKPTLETFPDSSYFYFDNISDLIMALRQDKIDGFVYDEPVLRIINLQQPDIGYFSDLIREDNYSFGFQKTGERSRTLRSQFNEMMSELTANGTIAEMKKKWFTADSASLNVDLSGLTGENGTLNVAVTSTNTPFTMITNGELSGYALELLTMFCRRYGYDCKYDQVNTSGGLAGLSSGLYDIFASNTTVTPERQESISFSDPIYSGGITLAVRASDLAPGGITKDSSPSLADDRTGFFEGIADSFEKNFIREDRWKLILEGIGTTCLITVLSALAGSLLAFLICMFRRTGSRLANIISDIYVKLLQGTPIVVLLMILYYVIFGKSGLEAVWVAVIGFSLNFGAYGSEIMRSGIESIDGGQREAALALGYSENQTFFRFIFPQAAVRFLPVYRGEIVSLLKSTSIVGYIAIQDLTKMSDIIRSRTYEAFFPLIATAVIYFFLAWIITLILKLILRTVTPKRR